MPGMPAPDHISSGGESHFQRTQNFVSTYSPHIFTEYVSKRTGMRVVIVDQEGPKVLGWFTVATEITDESGAPHTLEHLCFMGSKSYPYKSLLDKIANRAYSNTNAYTDTDHTVYTLEAGGYAAFAQILPVYLDHVLLPTLTDEGCYTEVFHINGEGHDAGVVYSEMQGRQNLQADLIELGAKRLMYPEGVGFRYDTGGLMEQLRVLTADRIRQFHRDMYQPKNLCVVVVGEVDHFHLLDTIDKFEEARLAHFPKIDAPFKRPWVESTEPPPLARSVQKTVHFPEEDESMGEVSIRYFGPHCEDVVQATAMEILLSYLAGSQAAVLDLAIVQKEQLASEVYTYTTPRPRSEVLFYLSGIETEKLVAVETRFHEILKQTAEKEIDMAYMADCINQEKRQRMLSAESREPPFTEDIIRTFLFSKTRDLAYLSNLEHFDQLAGWEAGDWLNFFKTWIVDNNYVTVLGEPSAALSKKLKDGEQARVASQIKEIGPKGLEELNKKLESAKAANDREIPYGLIDGFKVPPTDTIHFITTECARSGAARGLGVRSNSAQTAIDKEASDLPLFIQFEHVPSNFVDIHLSISTSTIPVKFRPLLTVYLENFFNTPIFRAGERIEFERVVLELFRDIVYWSMSSAHDLENPEMLDIHLQVERSNYGTAISWIRDLLWNSIFDIERIKSAVARLLASVPDEKRDADNMSYAAAVMTQQAPESIVRAQTALVKALYLKRVKRLLADEPQTVIRQLEELRNILGQISNFRILVVADVERLEQPVTAWERLTQGKDVSKPLPPMDRIVDRFNEVGKHPGHISYIIPMSTSDSSFLVATAKGPLNSKQPRVPALIVAIQYLNAVEGPLWTAVRGQGLAYGAAFSRSEGQLQFSIYRSASPYKALCNVKKLMEDLVSSVTSFDPSALEGALSSVVLQIVNRQATMREAAVDNFVLEVVKDLPRQWNDVILEKVRQVTPDELKAVISDMLLPIFDASRSNLFITCAPIMQEDLVRDLNELGFKPEVQPLAFFQDDYGLKAADGEGETSDDGDDDSIDEGEEAEDEDEDGRTSD